MVLGVVAQLLGDGGIAKEEGEGGEDVIATRRKSCEGTNLNIGGQLQANYSMHGENALDLGFKRTLGRRELPAHNALSGILACVCHL